MHSRAVLHRWRLGSNSAQARSGRRPPSPPSPHRPPPSRQQGPRQRQSPKPRLRGGPLRGGKCPFGSQCSKRNQTIKTRRTHEDAVESMIHHLATSPYHELQQREAETAVDYNIKESWEIDKKQWDIDRAKREAGKKRKSLQWHPHEERAAEVPAPPTRAGTGRITLSEMQLRACVDSLKRAKSRRRPRRNCAPKLLGLSTRRSRASSSASR
eukprot:3555134-Pyramimonas_sp.AAC.1